MAVERSRVTAAAMFAVIIVAWGLNYLFVRLGLEFVAPIWLAFLRAGVGALGAIAIWSAVGRPALSSKEKALAVALGLLNTSLFFGLWFVAAGSILPGEAAVVVYTFPLWVAILSTFVLDLRVNAIAAGAIGAGFVGVVLISEPWGAGGGALPPLPVAELLVGAIAWALGTVLIQKWFRPEAAQAVNVHQLLGGSAGLLAVALLLEPGQPPEFSVTAVAITLWLGLVGTALAYGLWFHLLGRMNAPTLSANMFLVPVVALVASAIFLSERIDLVQALGVVLVAAAVAVVGRRPPSR